MEECPKCLGVGEVYEPIENNVKECKLCEGEGVVEYFIVDAYDPLDEEWREQYE